ncbi:MAG: DUF2520 domain-containing protein [Actinobacteria bacterium]|nr:DUF2520 domain-containing protein [Actinomycetota bacterium]
MKEDKTQRFFIHFSGSKQLSVLEPARKSGALTGSIHPLKSFASISDSISTIPGTVFGTTAGGKKEKELIKIIVERLGGVNVEVKDRDKPLYHAAACIASNYLVVNVNYALSICEKIGMDPFNSLKGLENLIEDTFRNIKKMGPRESLTGPISRGDSGTVRDHIKNLKKIFNGNEIEIYCVMGKRAAHIACQNGWISKETRNTIIDILEDV